MRGIVWRRGQQQKRQLRMVETRRDLKDGRNQDGRNQDGYWK